MHEPTASRWIDLLGLVAHPEGGCFVETYRSSESIPLSALPSRYSGSRPFSTAIYFLLAGDAFSAFHRLQSDEIWHFYAGAGLFLYVIDATGQLVKHHLGSSSALGQVPQASVLRGSWLAARPSDPASYALLGCTTAPGFDFADFELGDRTMLLRRFPQHSDLIQTLTRMPT